MPESRPILALLSEATDRRDLQEALSGKRVQFVTNIQEAVEYLDREETWLVISERDPEGGNWMEVLERLERDPDPAYLVVVCRLADERFWAEVLNCGGYDVLEMPFRKKEVAHVVTSAGRQRDRALAVAG